MPMERISEFVDYHMNPIVKVLATVLSDTSDFLRGLDSLRNVLSDFNSFASQASFIDRARSTAEKFHIFGSVHAMKTEIPPFDSEIKDLTNSSL
jgi:hypothetical protein